MSGGNDEGADAAASETTVLIVEDEVALADLYRIWLEDAYDVCVANDGEAGLSAMSEDVDVVVLDRRLPGMSGDDVLRSIKEEGYDAMVVMATAVDAATDIVDLPLDDYVNKPLTKPVLRDVIERLCTLARADAAVREYHSLERRRDVIRTARDRTGATDTEAFERLTTRLEAAAKDAGSGLAWLRKDYYELES
jgi:DNA-binding response OmpR family regulator